MAERRLERGIYRDDVTKKWRLYVRAAGHLYTKRLARTFTLPQVRDERDQWARALRPARTPDPPALPSGTFASDATRYLAAVASMPTYAWRAQDIALWVHAFGATPRRLITTADIDAVLHQWRNAGYAGSTIRHRRTALLHLWHRLDGKSAPNPVRDSFKPDEAEPEARGLPYGMVTAILRRLRPSKTKARLTVMAWTGLAQQQLAELQPADVDWQAPAVYVRRRKKGKRQRGFMKPLTAEGLEALRVFDRWDCWGSFSRDSLRKSFRLACRKLLLGGLKPYDLRHSYGTAVYEASGDIKATMEAMGHGDIRTTMRYTLRAVEPRVQAAVAAFGRKVKTEVTPKP